MTRRRPLAILLVLMALAGCTPRPAGTGTEGQLADRLVTLPSGATLKVAAGWSVTARGDGVTLEDPEKKLKLEVVEITGSEGTSEALSAAWMRRRRGFDFVTIDPGVRGFEFHAPPQPGDLHAADAP